MRPTVRGLAALCVAVAVANGGREIAAAEHSRERTTARPTPPGMSADELKAFLARPLVARLATVRANCTPQLVPMWFLHEDGVLYMSTRVSAAKLKHLRHNPHVAVVVDEMEAPLKNKIVTIEGTAEVQTTAVQEITTKIYEKYVGKERATSGAAQHNINEPRVILKIIPKKIQSVDTTR